mmetsp:Transcript_10375/g.18933  ORF Transcript_10375/g.18933 Transcript_10375/m.18933 type:complete len:355 (+) Transcript_10375:66-1130(+)
MRLFTAAKLSLLLSLVSASRYAVSASRYAGNSSLERRKGYVEEGVLSQTHGTPHTIHIHGKSYACKALAAGASGIIFSVDDDPSIVIKLPKSAEGADEFKLETLGSAELANHGIKTVATSWKPDEVTVTYNGNTHPIAGALIKQRIHGADLEDIIQVLCLSNDDTGNDAFKPDECLLSIPPDKRMVKGNAKYQRVKEMLAPHSMWENLFGNGNRRGRLAAEVIPQVKCMWQKLEAVMKDHDAKGYPSDLKPANFMWDFKDNALYLVDFMYFRDGSDEYNHIKNNHDAAMRGITLTWNVMGGSCLGTHWTDTHLPDNLNDVFTSQECHHEHHGGLSLHPKKYKKGHKQGHKQHRP